MVYLGMSVASWLLSLVVGVILFQRFMVQSGDLREMQFLLRRPSVLMVPALFIDLFHFGLIKNLFVMLVL